MIKAAIVAGRHSATPRLVHLLHTHPDVELVAFGNKEMAGHRLADIYPSMTGETDLRVTAEIDWKHIDVVFLALAPGETRALLRTADLPADLRIIDMTGDYSLPDDTHDFVQGIPELNRKALVRGATHVSMPDSRTTAIALGLLPLAKNLMLNSAIRADIVTSNATAVPGSMSAITTQPGVADELKAALTSLQNSFNSTITGLTFSGDIPSGMMAVMTLDCNIAPDELTRLYTDYYADHNFTFVVDRSPDTADVRNTNKCFVHLEPKDGRLTVTTVLDTAMKGSAGNAVHAMNLLFGLIERVGL